MDETEKQSLQQELDVAIHEHSHTTPNGEWSNQVIIEPTSLRELLRKLIELS